MQEKPQSKKGTSKGVHKGKRESGEIAKKSHTTVKAYQTITQQPAIYQHEMIHISSYTPETTKYTTILLKNIENFIEAQEELGALLSKQIEEIIIDRFYKCKKTFNQKIALRKLKSYELLIFFEDIDPKNTPPAPVV